MKRRIITAMLVAIALIATAISVSRETIHANAQQEESAEVAARSRDLTLFGMIGLARGQTARLNVVNLRSVPALEPTPDQVVTLVPCTIRLRFVDQRGNTIVRSVENILPGAGAFLDLPFHEAIPRGFEGKRIEIRASVRALSRPDDERRRCATISTLEIFDSETGHTSVIYPESPR
jgi:hypothetical protein